MLDLYTPFFIARKKRDKSMQKSVLEVQVCVRRKEPSAGELTSI